MLSKPRDIFRFVVHWPPNVGICIALLALVAVVMTTRGEDITRAEKIAWVVCSFLLLIGEIYAMKTKVISDANDALAARVAQDDHFGAILAQNQKDFDATVARLDSVAALAERSLMSAVGGDSFCYTEFSYFTPFDGLHPLTVALGDYPLYDVVVRIVDLAFPFPKAIVDGTINIAIGNMSAKSAMSHNVVLPFGPSHGNFNLFFSARNGFWTETYRSIVTTDGRRTKAIRVFRDLQPDKVLYESVDKDFPRDADGKVKW